MENTRNDIRKLAMILNKIDEMYYSSLSSMGAKASELWLLYALDDENLHSQKQIREEWGLPATTINTTTKQLEADGYLTLSPIPGKRRERNILLTESGKAYAKKLLAPIYAAENEAMEKVSKKYSLDFIEVMFYLSECLEDAFQKNANEQNGEI